MSMLAFRNTALQRLLNQLLGKYKGRRICAFVEDVSIGSQDTESHIMELEEIVDCMMRAGTKLKLIKCLFGVRSVKVLGNQAGPTGLYKSDGHVDAIKKSEGVVERNIITLVFGRYELFLNIHPGL